MNRRITATVLSVLAATSLAACGGDDESSDSDAPAETKADEGSDDTQGVDTPAGASISIADFTISSATVAAGEEVTITNADGAPHTVTDQDGAFDVRLDGKGSGTLTIADAGTYQVFCAIHPSMTATITVN
jgi:plastocyanin